jgi:hypothetical protein
MMCIYAKGIDFASFYYFYDRFCLFVILTFNILCIMFRIRAYKAAPFTRLCVSVYILHVLLPLGKYLHGPLIFIRGEIGPIKLV